MLVGEELKPKKARERNVCLQYHTSQHLPEESIGIGKVFNNKGKF